MKMQDTLSAYQFHELFPDEESAVAWFESTRWPDGRYCPHCGSVDIAECAKPQPYRCRDCRKHFSARTGTAMQSSKLPVEKWLYAMYLISVSKKGLSSLQLARALGIAQEAAWRLGHKIRQAWNQGAPLGGEVDEAHIGCKERNKRTSKRRKAGRGSVGKQPVTGSRERKTGRPAVFPVNGTDAATMQPEVRFRVDPGSTVYTNGRKSYQETREYRPEAVPHHAGEYMREKAHGMESIWALLKRGYAGTFHLFSVKRLSRFADEFCDRQSDRDLSELDFMRRTAASFEGRLLTHRQPVGGDGV